MFAGVSSVCSGMRRGELACKTSSTLSHLQKVRGSASEQSVKADAIIINDTLGNLTGPERLADIVGKY
jgi:hypothetical protein